MKMYKAKVRHDEDYSEIVFNEFDIIGETPKCYYVADHRWNNFTKKQFTKRLVPKEGKNCFAFTTKELALNNLFYRQKFYASILRQKLEIAGKARACISNMIAQNTLTDNRFSHYSE